MNNKKRPPLGLVPKDTHSRKRFYDVCAAISRYYNAGLPIPLEWVVEYNVLVQFYGDLNDINESPEEYRSHPEGPIDMRHNVNKKSI